MNTIINEQQEDNWLKQLKNDLMRTNKLIKKTRIDVDEGIKQLKLLEQERKRLVNETLKIDEFDEVDVI
jgi:hypothetical protein